MNSQTVDLQELGLKFEIPNGWTGQYQGDYIIFGHTTIPGLMIVFANTAASAEELKQLAAQGIMEEGVHLEAKGEFNVISEEKIEGYYQGNFQGAQVLAFAIGLINTAGSGLNVLILTENDKFTDAHISEANKLANTVQFFKPKVIDNTLFWQNRIVGTQLKYMHTSGGSDYMGGYSGTSEVEIINLCSNGDFTFYSNSNASFDGSGGFGYANTNEDSRGTYKISSQGNQTFLILHFQNDKVLKYELSVNNQQHTLLNNSRYFITTLEGCD